MLVPLFTCYAYDYKADMDEYFEKTQKDIYESKERADRREALRLQEETNRAIQRELSPLNNINKQIKVCPG